MGLSKRRKQPASSSSMRDLEEAAFSSGISEFGDSPNYPLKKGAGRPLVTLSLDDDTMRVVAFQGRKVVAWGTASLEKKSVSAGEDVPTLDADGSATEDGVSTEKSGSTLEERQAVRLRSLLDELGISGGSMVTDLPLYTPIMRRLEMQKLRGRHVAPLITSTPLRSSSSKSWWPFAWLGATRPFRSSA